MSIRIFRPAAFLCLLLAGACGNSGPTTNLKPVFFRNVPTAPVVTLTMLRHHGITPAVAGGNATTATFTTELFKGSYRAMVFATPVTSTDTLEPFETSLFSPAGGGATETQTVALKSAGNLVSLHLSDGPAPVPDNQI